MKTWRILRLLVVAGFLLGLLFGNAAQVLSTLVPVASAADSEDASKQQLDLKELAPILDDLQKTRLRISDQRTRDAYLRLHQYGPVAKKAVPELIRLMVSVDYHNDSTWIKLLRELDGDNAVKSYYSVVVEQLNKADSAKKRYTTASRLKSVDYGVVSPETLFSALKDSALNDPEIYVRQEAVLAIRDIYGHEPVQRKIGKKEFLNLFIILLNGETRELRRIGAVGLEAMGRDSAPATSPLINALDDRPTFHAAAFNALGAIGPASKQANNALVELLGDDLEWNRANAAQALGKIRPPYEATITALVRSLDDSSSYVREFAAEALGNYGHDAKNSATDKLVERLLDPKEQVRRAAIQALTKIGPDRKTIPNLLHNLDENELPSGASFVTFRTLTIDCLLSIGSEGRSVAARALAASRSLRFSSDSSAQTLSILPELRDLEELTLSGAHQVKSDGFSHIGAMKGLRKLTLQGMEVAPECFEHLVQLARLEELDLDLHATSDTGLQVISQMKQLKSLRLVYNLSDEGVRHMESLVNLETLTLRSCKVSDDGLAQLTKLPKLKHLELLYLPLLTNDGVEHIGRAGSLRSLSLDHSKEVTDAALRYLTELEGLKSLSVRGTKITRKALQELRDTLPNLNVVHGSKLRN